MAKAGATWALEPEVVLRLPFCPLAPEATVEVSFARQYLRPCLVYRWLRPCLGSRLWDAARTGGPQRLHAVARLHRVATDDAEVSHDSSFPDEPEFTAYAGAARSGALDKEWTHSGGCG
jgi:hypothetical protein